MGSFPSSSASTESKTMQIPDFVENQVFLFLSNSVKKINFKNIA